MGSEASVDANLQILIELHARVSAASKEGLAEAPFDALQFAVRRDLAEVFGEDSPEVREVAAAGEIMAFTSQPAHWWAEQRVRALRDQVLLFDEIVARHRRARKTSDESARPTEVVLATLRKFHAVALQLRDRHEDRATLTIRDEYDVQDLLKALLRIHFDDVRTEEWTPSYAGGSSRMDFLLKEHAIVIETKMARPTLTSRKLGEELLVDIARYAQHADCKHLICFVYDPSQILKNPVGLERDLSNGRQAIGVSVLVSPKP